VEGEVPRVLSKQFAPEDKYQQQVLRKLAETPRKVTSVKLSPRR